MSSRRIFRGVCAVLIAAGAAIGVPGTPAYADTTCNPGIGHHCWERLDLHGEFIGDYLYTKSSCLVVTSPSAAFVTNETWMLNQPASTAYWVEAGQAYGSPQGARRYFYWADQRPGHGYSEHDDTSSDTPSLGKGYFDYIDQYTATSYSVASGPWSGTSTGWASGYTFGELQTGTETSNDGQEVAERGQSYGLGYYNTPSNYGHTNWTYGSNTPGKFPSPTDWGSISTVSTYSDYEINATSTCTLGNAASSKNAVTAAQLKSASVSLFKRNATADSGHKSYLATWADSTAAVAERSLYGSFSSAHSSPVTDAAAPVMVLVATGARFTVHDAKIPAGAAAPTGSVLTEIIDLTTGRIRDWGVTTHNPGLSRLGFVHNLA